MRASARAGSQVFSQIGARFQVKFEREVAADHSAGNKYPSVTYTRAVQHKVKTILQQGFLTPTGGRSVGNEMHRPVLTTLELRQWADDE